MGRNEQGCDFWSEHPIHMRESRLGAHGNDVARKASGLEAAHRHPELRAHGRHRLPTIHHPLAAALHAETTVYTYAPCPARSSASLHSSSWPCLVLLRGDCPYPQKRGKSKEQLRIAPAP